MGTHGVKFHLVPAKSASSHGTFSLGTGCPKLLGPNHRFLRFLLFFLHFQVIDNYTDVSGEFQRRLFS